MQCADGAVSSLGEQIERDSDGNYQFSSPCWPSDSSQQMMPSGSEFAPLGFEDCETC
jgi:hypothetical protein